MLTQVLSEIQNEYGRRGVQVIESAMEPTGATVPGFIRTYRPNFPVGWNNPVDILNYLQVPVITPGYVPKMVFIDREGVIRAEHGAGATVDPYFEQPGANIRVTLNEMLKAPVRKAPVREKKKAAK